MADTYRRFIDAMAELACTSVMANRISAHHHAERTNEHALPLTDAEARRKAALLSMTSTQREAVVELLRMERIGGVHDVVANLDAHGLHLEGRALFDHSREEPKFDLLDRIEQMTHSGSDDRKLD